MFCFAEFHWRDAAVFWDPRRCAHVMPVIAERASGSLTILSFHPRPLPCRATVLLAHDKSQYVLLRNAQRSLQLAISGADILQPACLSADAIWPAAHLKHRLWVLECLNNLYAYGQLPGRLFPPEKRWSRLTFVIFVRLMAHSPEHHISRSLKH